MEQRLEQRSAISVAASKRRAAGEMESTTGECELAVEETLIARRYCTERLRSIFGAEDPFDMFDMQGSPIDPRLCAGEMEDARAANALDALTRAGEPQPLKRRLRRREDSDSLRGGLQKRSLAKLSLSKLQRLSLLSDVLSPLIFSSQSKISLNGRNGESPRSARPLCCISTRPTGMVLS